MWDIDTAAIEVVDASETSLLEKTNESKANETILENTDTRNEFVNDIQEVNVPEISSNHDS